jgi:hypothetical protein
MNYRIISMNNQAGIHQEAVDAFFFNGVQRLGMRLRISCEEVVPNC